VAAEEVVEGVLSHAEHLAMPRDTPLKKTLFACDELSGFVHACGLVRPDGIDTLEPRSVRKKLKQPSFAAGVHRDEVYAGAELLGLELDEHIGNVVEALRPIAPRLGLRTAAAAEA
jgi:predicted hydrolase (HD superfamily)